MTNVMQVYWSYKHALCNYETLYIKANERLQGVKEFERCDLSEGKSLIQAHF